MIGLSRQRRAKLAVERLVGNECLGLKRGQQGIGSGQIVLLTAGQMKADRIAKRIHQRVFEPLAEAGKAAVIPPRKTRKTARAFDTNLYQARHLIENFFAKLKQFRAIATRYDKTARCFLAGIHLAAAAIWLN